MISAEEEEGVIGHWFRLGVGVGCGEIKRATSTLDPISIAPVRRGQGPFEPSGAARQAATQE